MKYALLFLVSFAASADTVILSCDDAWGSSSSFGGCTGMKWKTPAPNLKVKTDSNDFWVLQSTLVPTDIVYTATGKRDGDIAIRADAIAVAFSTLSGSTPPPPPPPTVPPTNPVYDIVATWTAPSGATGYKFLYNLVGATATQIDVGNVLTYTITAPPAGNYEVRVIAYNATGDSPASNPATVTITARPVDPPPPPPPTPQPTVVEVPGTYSLKKGTTNVETGLASYAVCYARAVAVAPVGTTAYNCTLVGNKITVTKP